MAEFKLGRLRFVWKGEWTTATAYVKDDIIRYGGTSYVCVQAHTANADFYVDRDANRWEVITAGLQYQSAEWSTGVVYAENDIVRYGGRVYIALEGHTAGADFFADKDSGKWNLFSDGVQWKTSPWSDAVLYKEGDLVRYGGRVYICIDGHTSGSVFENDFNSAKWQLFVDGTQWVNAWTASTLYKVGDIVRVSGKTYICVNEHTADATQRGGFYNDLANWNLYADGNQFRSAWDTTEYYWLGDFVRYGAKTYVCLEGHEADTDFYVDFDANRWALFNDGQQWVSDWENGTYYKEGDIAKHGGSTYICIDGHFSDSSAVEGFDRDLDQNFWEEFSTGYDWKAEWVTGTYYKLNDIVRYGAKAYIAVDGHVAAADFYTDADAGRWQLLVDGQQWKTSPWLIGTLYKEGDLVRYGGRVYICIDGHTSTSFENRFDIDFDSGKWQLFSDGTQWKTEPWTAGEYYKTGDIVKYGAKTYVALDDHTADSEQDGGFYTDLAAELWDLYADGTEWRGDWMVQNYYRLGDIVRYDGNVYICQIPHRSANTIEQGLEFDLDLDSTQSKWDVFSEGFKFKGTWDTDTKYNVNDVVKFGGSLYICIGYHTSDISSFEEQYWNILIGGLEFEDTWNPNVEYQIGDIVTYGGYSYVAQERNTGRIPPGFAETWNLLTTGFKVTGEWSPTRSYKVGELVKYGGSSYVAVVETGPGQKPTNEDGSTSILWEIVAPGIKWRGEWTEDTQYRLGDAVRWTSNSYICLLDHTSIESSLNQPDNDSEGVYWEAIAEGGEGNKLARRGDLLTRTATQNVRLPRGQAGQVLQVSGRDVVWDYFNVVDNVYYVDIGGEDAPDRGTSLQTAFRTIKYATEYILADEATRAPATIFVKTGTFREQLPIIIPANVAIVGDELRSTKIEPASGFGIDTIEITTPGAGYATAPEIDFTEPNLPGGTKPTATATVVGGEITEIVITNHGSGYTTEPVVIISDTGTVQATAQATLKSKPYSQTDMFYMRDGSGLRNCTVAGLDIPLSAPNQYLTRRPSTDCAYVSLDPGFGPGDESTWIINRSPYVQNVTTFGNGAVGMKIDGSLHNGGAKTMVCNDFTQVISDGIGIWATNNGRVEAVSVFTYYAHLGYLAEDGGVIRGTNGNCSYGTFGVAAEGVDPSEVSRIARVDNRREEADVRNTFVDGNGIVVLEYGNAGTDYQTDNTTYTFDGSGVAGSIQVSAVNIVDGGVSQVRVLEAGEGWLAAINNSQDGTSTSIRLSASDTQVTDAYKGERIVIIDGQGVGQYGYITRFNGGTKVATVAKESFKPLVITATSSANNRLTTTDTSTLSIDQAVTFENTNDLLGGLIQGRVYYVRAVSTSTEFTLSETLGGSELNLTTDTGVMNLHSAGFESLYSQPIKTVLDTTTRYTIEPRVVFSTGEGASVTGEISPGVDLISLSTNGGYYQTAPTVVISGTESDAIGAAATATISGSVETIRIRQGGSGYLGTPNVTFLGGGLPNGSPNHASGSVNVTGKIVSVAVTDGGSGFTVPPEVEVTGAGYNGDAYISAKITNIVGNVGIISGGSNYTSVPNVIFSGGGGSGAQAVANLNAQVTGFTIVEGGSGYTPITTSISIVPAAGDTVGAGATAEVVIDNGTIGGPGVITGVTLTNPGSGYTKPPRVIITSTGLGEDAEVTALINGSISSVTVTQGGSGYVTAPNVAFSFGNATASATITGAVSELEIINGGTGFTDTATLTIVPKDSGVNATAVATVDRVVESVTLISSGTGYTSPPTVAIAGGGGTGALATAILDAEVTGVTVTLPGSGYNTVPTVAFAGAHNFKSIVAGEAYYRNSSSLVAVSNLQITQTLAAMDYIKVLANSIANNTEPTTVYQTQQTRSGTATAPAGAYEQTVFWIDVVKALAQNGADNSVAADLINDNKSFIVAEVAAYAAANNSGNITYTEAELRKRTRTLVDALVYDMTNGTAERTVSLGQKYAYLFANEFSATIDTLDFLEDLIQQIILNQTVTPLNTESAVQVFAELLASEITAPTAVTNLVNLFKSLVALDGVVGNTANDTYTDLLLDNIVWIQAETIEYIKDQYPNFDYNESLCGRDIGLIVDAVAHDVRYAQDAIPVASATTTNVLSGITIVSGGEGYGQGTTVSFSGDVGTGAAPAATPVITNGVITGFNITQPGKGFSVAPTIAVTADTGSGALARVLVLGEAVQEFRIIRPGSGYNAPPFVKLVDPNNSKEGRYQVRISDGVLDQPTFSSRGTGYLAVRTEIESPTGYADNFQVGEFVYIDNLTNIPTPGANIQFGDNPTFYKLVTIRNLAGDAGILGGRSLIVANRRFIQKQTIAYINAQYPTLDYNQALCERDVGLIVDAIVADIFGDTERGIEAGKSYFRNASGLLSISGNQRTATIDAINKIEDYIEDIVQNIDIARNQLFELQVKEPNVTGGAAVIPAVRNTVDIILDIIENGDTIYAVQDLLLDNKAYIQAEVIAFINTTYPEFIYNQELCNRDVGLIIDAIAYDLFAGLAENFETPNVPSGLTRSREAGLRYYSNTSALLAITDQKDQTIAAIEHIKTVALAVVSNTAPSVIYQTAVPQFFNFSVFTTPTLNGRIEEGIDEIINIIDNGLSVLPQGTYSARFQVSPPFTVDNAPNHDDQITVRSKYSQVRISAHDFLNVGTGNKAETNYPGLPVNAPEPENEVLEAGGGRVFYTSTDQDGNFRVGELFAVEQATGIATLNADAFNLSGLNELTLGGINIGGTGATITEFSTDSTFLANSDSIVPTQRAVRTYIASQLGSGGGNLAVNAITAGDVQVTGNAISTNFPEGLELIVPEGVFITEIVESTNPQTGSLVVDGGVGVGGDLNIGDDVNVGGDLVVTGNLTVNGDTTTLNVGTLTVEDTNIVISKGAVDAAAADGAGITVEGPATAATFTYASADDSWNFNKPVKATSVQNTPIGSSTANTGAFTTLTANNDVTFTKGTGSTGANNGTVVVTGGVGISENLNVGGSLGTVNLTATGNTTLSPANASVQVNPSGTGGVVISPTGSAGLTINPTTVGTINNVNIGNVTRGPAKFTTLETNGDVLITSATASTSVDSGALQVDGGAGINGAVYAGSIQNTPIGSTTANTGRFTTGTFTDTTASSSVTTGAVTVAGGMGVAGALWAGSINVNGGGIDNTPIGATTANTGAFTTLTANNAVTFTANTASSSSATGALVVTGGVGIGGNLNVGGQLTITGNLVVNGTTSTINSTTLSVDDINITLGDTASPTDTTANGGGITLRGTSDKTITWVQSTGYWTFNQPIQASSVQNTPIGSATRNTGAFTSLAANAAVTFTQGTASTTTGTGTLVVTGGVGVSGQVTAATLSGNHTGGSGSFTTLTASSTVTLSPANASVTISPTGTGTVTMAPATAGTINNMSIGTTTRAAGAFTTLSANSTFSLTDATESSTTTTGALVVAGGVGIAKNLNVGGALRAISKSFLIDHPTKDGYKLQYGSLEGPENGVYVRGRTQTAVVELPDYWTGLVDESTITVDLTAVGGKQDIWVEKIEDNRVYIGGDLRDCFYTVYGERKDIDKLTVEYKA